MVIVQVFDKSSMQAVEKAIRDSDLGVNPTNDGNVIRVVFPELSEERRREYIKVAGTKAEESRVSVRNIRRRAKDTLDKLAKDGEAWRTRSGVRRRSSTTRRTATWRRSTSCSSTRRPNCSRFDGTR